MSMTDPVADMLTRIRNAGMARFDKVDIPASKLKARIAEILKEEGYIEGFRIHDETVRGVISIDLRYDQNRRMAMRGLKRVSKPGRRVYAAHDEIPRVRNGLGLCIVSTSQGVMTDREARRRGVGGELLCEVW